LIYDLLIRRGLGNVKWRTPGADGGRDIEGEFAVYDFSGATRPERWYVECKRYRSAVDWPTVHGKLAYAHNQGADYLLIATTSSLSPAARDEVSLWNRTQRRPAIREWGGVEIERYLSADPLLTEKYGLSVTKRDREVAAVPLLTTVTKVMHQVYGESYLQGEPTPALEFAAAASEYAANWLNGRGSGTWDSHSRLDVDRDLYPWCQNDKQDTIGAWDAYALRATLTAVRFFSDMDLIKLTFSRGNPQSVLIHVTPGSLGNADRALSVICTMANWEWSVLPRGIKIIARANT